jgi:TRAP-type uncharacterized transport system substrate-binding protein
VRFTVFSCQAPLYRTERVPSRSCQGAKAIELGTQNNNNTTIPWHPGAIKFFTEKGAKM